MKINKKSILPIFLILIGIGLKNNTYAWGVTGHRVVAEIAQRHLDRKAKKEIKKLIGTEPLAYWANWPDFIKSDTTDTWKSTSSWHYVDLPAHMQKLSFISDLKSIDHPNLYTQIKEMELELSNKSLSLEKRQIALRFLIHFIGDLHQPLHVGRDEDAGGNKITVFWFNKKTNLHSVWDSELVDFQKWSYTEYANNIDVLNKHQIESVESGTLEDWFFESHQLADDIYDHSPENANLSYGYNYLYFDKLNTQLLDGGLRLAKILNDILG